MEKEKLMRIAITLLILVALAGCTTTPQRIDISTKPIEKPKLIVPEADVLNLKDIEWVIITEENYEEVWKRLEADKVEVVLFGLTDKGYETLTLNMSDIMSHIQQQKSIIAAYKNYYEESEEAIEEANQTQQSIQNQVDEANKQNEDSKPWWSIGD